MKRVTKNLEETYALAAKFVGQLQPHASVATVLGLEGDLGSGKTSFVQGVARALGVTEHVTSPTFVIMKKYKLHNKNWKSLVHIDAYRLEGKHDLGLIGFNDLSRDHGNLILVEWPERVGLTGEISTTHFTFIDENTRGIIWT